MAVFVHLTSEKNVKRILENGIKASPIDEEVNGIYCMAVTQNFFISHQWLRELKRDGQKTIVGIYFKLKSDEKVLFGHYNNSRVRITAGEAVKTVMGAPDVQGYEIIIPRSVTAKEIYKVKHLPQVLGWRYYPEAHGKHLCLCPACIRKGTINSVKLREDKYRKLLAKLKSESNELEVLNLLSDITELIIYTPHRLRNIDDFGFLVEYPSERIKASLAYTLSRFQSEKALPYLLRLLGTPNDEVRRASADAIMHIKGTSGFQYLESYKEDSTVSEIINDYIDIYSDEE